VQEFTDTISRARFSRAGLDALMRLVRKGKVDSVLCFRLDRLGRFLGHLAQLIGELTANRVALIVPGQGIDTTAANPAATLQVNILCAIAQFERELIRERVVAGIASAKANGVRFGRPRTLDQHRQEVAALVAAGRTTRQIASELGIPKSSAAELARQARGGGGVAVSSVTTCW
jgi:DNA invertase Pin-like site-specific DNA recombinase